MHWHPFLLTFLVFDFLTSIFGKDAKKIRDKPVLLDFAAENEWKDKLVDSGPAVDCEDPAVWKECGI